MREEEKQLEITRLPCTGLGSGVLKECTAVGYPGLTKSLLLLPWWPEEVLALLWCPHVLMHQKERLFHPVTKHIGLRSGKSYRLAVQESKLFPPDIGMAAV